jgi:hypothetical protein
MPEVRSAIWARRVTKWKRWAYELSKDAGAIVTFPEDLHIPPHERIAKPSTDT